MPTKKPNRIEMKIYLIQACSLVMLLLLVAKILEGAALTLALTVLTIVIFINSYFLRKQK